MIVNTSLYMCTILYLFQNAIIYHVHISINFSIECVESRNVLRTRYMRNTEKVAFIKRSSRQEEADYARTIGAVSEM